MASRLIFLLKSLACHKRLCGSFFCNIALILHFPYTRCHKGVKPVPIIDYQIRLEFSTVFALTISVYIAHQRIVGKFSYVVAVFADFHNPVLVIAGGNNAPLVLAYYLLLAAFPPFGLCRHGILNLVELRGFQGNGNSTAGLYRAS
jgi:hypothetical protein